MIWWNSTYPKNQNKTSFYSIWLKGNIIIEEEEEGKVILNLLSVIYDFEKKKCIFKLLFSCFDYFLFILTPKKPDKVAS